MSNILPKKSWHVYNDKNREKVKHDQEKDLIEKEVRNDKLDKDQRKSRLEELRQRRSFPTSNTLNLVEIASSNEDERQDVKLKRFTLFPEDDVANPTKKTKTQGEVERNRQLLKPVRLVTGNDIKPWYTRDGPRQTPTKVGTLTRPEKKSSSPKSIDDLRRDRTEREALEREKANRLLKTVKR